MSQRWPDSSTVVFHLAFPSHDFALARQFYVNGLGCEEGRSSAHSLILNFYQHQIVAQKVKALPEMQKGIYPRHFGLVFRDKRDWDELLARAKDHDLRFYHDAQLSHPGMKSEYHRFFLIDPSNNLLEFKHYQVDDAIFGASTGDQNDAVGELQRS